ncbi:winged helix-turn-helix domain-containing protein [Streptomyces sp. NPDC090021]|uniref:winged helix-turn-helix domain-containing protein n=1 Tax=Streptomyces sp. NPDC090021 TaxID=3365919 RepID=UPI00381D5B36
MLLVPAVPGGHASSCGPLHRLGWSPQVPAHRAVERAEQAVAKWRPKQWSQVRGLLSA